MSLIISLFPRGRVEAQYYYMENGTWNFLEPRQKNISDLSEGMDHLMLLSVSVAKIFLYFNIYKHISKTFNMASLKDNERRNKFRKVHYVSFNLSLFHILLLRLHS